MCVAEGGVGVGRSPLLRRLFGVTVEVRVGNVVEKYFLSYLPK